MIRLDVFRAEPIIQQAIEQNPKIDIIRSHFRSKFWNRRGSGRHRVLENVRDGQLMKLETKAVFLHIGADPCTEFAQDLGILDERSYILVNNNMETARRYLRRRRRCDGQDAGRWSVTPAQRRCDRRAAASIPSD